MMKEKVLDTKNIKEEMEKVFKFIDHDNQTFEDICQEAISHNADVYAFSSYVWNWNLVVAVSQRIRKLLPNAIIVLLKMPLN